MKTIQPYFLLHTHVHELTSATCCHVILVSRVHFGSEKAKIRWMTWFGSSVSLFLGSWRAFRPLSSCYALTVSYSLSSYAQEV